MSSYQFNSILIININILNYERINVLPLLLPFGNWLLILSKLLGVVGAKVAAVVAALVVEGTSFVFM